MSDVDLAETRVAVLDAMTLATTDGPLYPVDGWTVLYCYPGAFAPGSDSYPPGWSEIPGTRGCALESTTYRDSHPACLQPAPLSGASVPSAPTSCWPSPTTSGCRSR